MIDPTNEEEVCQDGSLVLACMPARNEVTQLTLTGEWSVPKINEVCISLLAVVLHCLNVIFLFNKIVNESNAS